jgi:hypothetical protein
MTCKKYHDLTYETKLGPPYGKKYCCDECRVNGFISMGVFHCFHCNFDKCLKCVGKYVAKLNKKDSTSAFLLVSDGIFER